MFAASVARTIRPAKGCAAVGPIGICGFQFTENVPLDIPVSYHPITFPVEVVVLATTRFDPSREMPLPPVVVHWPPSNAMAGRCAVRFVPAAPWKLSDTT